MATKYGKALVAAGKEHMSVTDLGSVYPDPNPPPPPPPVVTEPPAIAGQGYSIVFEDDFDTIDTTIWRYQRFDKAEQPSKFSVANSIMTITNSAGDTSIDLMTKAPYSWQYGYIEGRMRYTANRASWASIWMMSDRHISGGACVTPGVLDDTKVCEFDMLESNHQFETQVSPFTQTYRSHFGTAHSNTGGGCSLADTNLGWGFNYINDTGTVMAGQWRTFAGLWTPSTLKWYVDDVLLKTATPYASFDQPMRLFLAMYRHPNEGTATLTTEVDWCRVWQQ
jgi:beta-glucanase (GH16 family)